MKPRQCTFKIRCVVIAIVLLVSVGVIFAQVNNAGAMINQRELTEDGLENNFAVNTLGK